MNRWFLARWREWERRARPDRAVSVLLGLARVNACLTLIPNPFLKMFSMAMPIQQWVTSINEEEMNDSTGAFHSIHLNCFP